MAVSIAPSALSVTEGNLGTVDAVFNITLSAPEATAVSVQFQTADGVGVTGATVAGGDYFAANGSVSFNPGTTSQPITVQVRGDTLDETDEIFTVNLSNFTGTGGIANGTGTVTVRDDDGPAIVISDVQQAEGNAGNTAFVFNVDLAVASPQQISVNYATSPGTATPNVDYNTTSGVLSFAPGITRLPVTVQVIGDTQVETSETFFVNLSGSVNATIADPQGQGTIVDDENPTLSINDVQIFEGNDEGFGSFRDMVFQVTMSRSSPSNVTVEFSTADGTPGIINTQPTEAINQADFTAASGVLTFAPGETLKNVTVRVRGENMHELDETFFVNLNNPTGANILDPQGLGTIINDDQVPQITFHDVAAVEGDQPKFQNVFPEIGPPIVPPGVPYTRPVNINISLSNPSSGTIVIDYAAINETAVGINDQLNRDQVDYRRSFPTPPFPGDPANAHTVEEQEPPFDLTGKVTFLPGEGAHNVVLRIFKDIIVEADETFILKGQLTEPNLAPAGVADDTGRVTIIDDDPKPSVNISDATVVEGDNDTKFLVFTVSLGGFQSEQNITVNYATVPGTASPGVDYVSQTGTLTFSPRISGAPGIPGERNESISIQILGDFIDEQDETFDIQLSNSINANIGSSVGTGLILDNEGPVINVDDVTVVEGNTGTVDAIFTVSLSATSVEPVTVGFFTSNVSANAGQDYVSNSGTLTFAPGTSTQNVTVRVQGDALFENTEFFLLNLTQVNNATINDNAGQGAIINDDVAPVITITDSTVTEGNSGQTQMIFTVTLDQPNNSAPVGVDYATFTGSAQANVDFASIGSNLVFPAGSVTQFITVSVFGDTTIEPNEDFIVLLTNPTNGTIGDNSATGVILDDDALPNITIDDVVAIEGDAGSIPFVFTVSLSKTSLSPVSVVFNAAPGTAVAGSDYTTTGGTLIFNAGETTKQVTVQVLGDMVTEPTETFFVNLSNPSQAFITDNQGQGTIIDNETAFLQIFDVTVIEGSFGGVEAVFDVRMSRAEATPVTVDFATSDGTAQAGADYTGTAGMLTFPTNSTQQFITVPILSDFLDEVDETFLVDLTNPVGASIFDGQAVGTIDDDDGPSIIINDVVVTEGNAGLVFADFNVVLSFASVQTVTVGFTTADGTAVGAGQDYFNTSGTITFMPGERTKTIRVNVLGDATDELDETFFVSLIDNPPSSPTNATIADNLGLGTIRDDDAPGIFISDTTVLEADSGQVFAVFQVTLSAPTVQPLSVTATTADGTATQNNDYFPTAVTLSFQPNGPVAQQVSVQIVPDPIPEADETFSVNLSNPTGGSTISDGQGIATITDDDTEISVNDITVVETDSGTQIATFTLTMTQPNANQVTVDFTTQDGTALAGSDYNTATGVATFMPNQTQRTVTVQVRGDVVSEDPETFNLVISNPVGAFLGDAVGTATILDNNDPPPNMSIAGVTVVEGNSGLTDAVFTVTISGATGREVTVNFSTADVTASSTMGPDYNSAVGILTFAPGETIKQITVPVVGDVNLESNETFTVTLSGANNANVATGVATGTIVDDDPLLTISSVTVNEGNGPVDAVFTVSLDKAGSVPVTADFSTSNGSAVAGLDYAAVTGSVSFAPGETVKTVTVQVFGDMVDENDETFQVHLTNIVGAANSTPDGVATIVDEDPQPTISINDVSVIEGDGGTVNAVFTVVLSQESGKTVTVNYATTNGSATAGADYQSASGALAFVPGEVAKVVTVAVNGDLQVEPDENFLVNLSVPVNALFGDSQGIGTIIDDEPKMSVADVTVLEGNNGTTDLVFSVVLTKAAGLTPVTVVYSTADGTAVNPADYIGASNTLTFQTGENSKAVTITVNNDLLNETNETFTFNLSNVSGATLTDGQAVGTILNDDPIPELSINDISLNEGNSGTTDFVFTVLLNAASGQQVSVNFNTTNGTAGSADYIATAGALVFNQGETSKAVTVRVHGENAAEPNETFFVNLSAPTNAALPDFQGVGTILNDEPLLSINDISINEADIDVNAVFTITMSRISAFPIVASYSTANGTALAPGDYTAVTGGLVTFQPGETVKTISVSVKGDLLDEDDETFIVNVASSSQQAGIGDNMGQATILDNDPLPGLSIGDVTITEGNAGTTNAIFNVMLFPASGRGVQVNYSTLDGTATAAGLDYNSTSGLLSFTPGSTLNTVTVQVRGDLIGEGNETFFIDLSGEVNASVLDGQAVGTIDDDEPQISVGDSSQIEGGNPANMIFAVTLDRVGSGPITFTYSTANGTATSPGDYTAASDTITFAAGETHRSITVPVTPDSLHEADETFFLNLSSPSSNAAIADAQGIGTIMDTDPAPMLAISDASVVEIDDENATTTMMFTVTLSSVSGLEAVFSYNTLNGSAIAPGDYNTVNQQAVTFLPGETSKQITVAVKGDTVGEGNETFRVQLANATGASVSDSEATGTIIDNEPSVSIGDASVVEGNGTANAVFNVSLSSPATSTVTVVYSSSGGTATQGQDYTAVSNTLTFLVGGSTAQQITVPVLADSLNEDNETFLITLGTISPNAQQGDNQGLGTIVDDDPQPNLLISNASLVEGDSGLKSMVFNVTLSAASGRTVTVNYATGPHTGPNMATANGDYQSTSGLVSFAPGETLKPIAVNIIGDTGSENNELFSVNLTGPNGAVLPANPSGVGTIVDDDAQISIGPATISEGGAAVFSVTLSKQTGKTVTANFATSNGAGPSGAVAPSDYVAATGSLSFGPQETVKFITVQTNSDTLDEADETFFVSLSGIAGAAAGVTQGLGTINNDDADPVISINNVQVLEGNAGAVNAVFTVSLNTVSGQPVSFNFSTANNTAQAGSDYVTTSGVLTFAPGEVQKQVVVQVLGDTIIEQAETFLVNLSNIANASAGDPVGVGTINDNEQANLIVTGAGAGGGPHVRAFQSNTLNDQLSFFAYSPQFRGGVRVTTADVNGDGQPDVITSPGAGGGPHVRVFHGKTGAVLLDFMAFEPGFVGGVNVAAGDVNLDGRADIIVGADGPGSGARTRVFDGATGAILQSIAIPNSAFSGGVRVAAGDINGDGRSDLIAAAGPGNTPRVMVLDVASGGVLADFFAYIPSFTGGVYVAAGDVNRDGRADIITGAGPGGGPHVRVLDGATRTEITGFFAYGAGFSGGVRVGTTDYNGDGVVDIITGAGPGGGPHVRVLNSANLQELAGFFAYGPGFTGGVYVSGSYQGPGSPLRSLDGSSGTPALPLASEQLQPLVDQAIAGWVAARGDSSLAKSLRQIDVRVADLPEGYLGMAFASAIYVDIDADGHGWFVDATPADDEEFTAGKAEADSPAANRMDLLSVLGHEFGHILGLDDLDLFSSGDDLMAEALSTGSRRSAADAVDAVFGDDWE